MRPTPIYKLLAAWLALLVLAGQAVAQAGVPRPIDIATAAIAPAAALDDPPPCGGTFTALADTFVNAAAPATNYGTSPQLVVGQGTGGAQQTLLAFNILRVIPAGATIHHAELVLTLGGAQPPNAFRMEVREVAEAWDELKANWDTRPALGSTYGAATYRQHDGIMRVDVTAAAIRWHTGVISNTGLALLPVDTGADITFISRNSVTGGPALGAPKLVVECATPDDVDAPDQTAADQRQTAGIARLRQSSGTPLRLSLKHGVLDFATFDIPIPPAAGNDRLAQTQWFLREYSDALRLDDANQQLQLIRRSDDGQSLFFRQRHHGIPVYPATLGVHLEGQHVRGLGGNYLPDISIPATPRLTSRQAEALAGALLGDGSVRPGDGSVKPGDGSVRPQLTGDTQLRYLNLGLLGGPDTRTYLTWRVNGVGVEGPVSLFIDAFDGALRYKQSHTMHDFDLEYLSDANHETSESCFVFVNTDEWFDEDGVISGANPDAEGYMAFNNIKATYNYWKNRFGRDSYDNDGEEIEMYIHVGNNWNNAGYLGGICDIFEYGDDYPVNDVVGHEFTHAVDNSEGELIYAYQSGALDESFADIFGYFVDSGDWTMGEDIPGGPLRDLSNPPAFGDPDRMANYVVTTSDDGGVHTNSGINNKAAFLIINGGTHNGVTVQGIGKTKAERLFYNVLTKRLWDSSNFMDARNMAVFEGLMQLGAGNFSANDICQISNAYAAVELGQVDTDCDGQPDSQDPDNDNDGVTDGPDNCNNIANPGQADADGDGQGDACDNDIDNDGVANSTDNCDYVANPNQNDWNGDGQGDKCDDSDQDGVKDSTDNCRTAANADQKNTDGDSQGDACDSDDDGDGVPDATDNCPLTPNPDQKDSDNDGIGDACDKCPGLSDPDNTDTDNDGLGNPCDPDDDNDGIPDGEDICPLEPGYGCLELDETPVDDDFFIGFFSRFPIPHCIMCGGEYLPPGLEVMVDVGLPVGFAARIVNSEGVTVAKGKALGGGNVGLSFDPAAFSGPQIGLAAAPKGTPTADEIRYYLEIIPAPGVDTSQPYPLTVAVHEGIPGTVYMALVAR